MEKYTDIHCHILPGVDDGAQDLDTSLRMLHMAEENGIGRIILTPHNKPMHHNVTPKETGKKIERLRTAMEAEGISMELYPGNELYYRSGVLEELDADRINTMADSAFVLLEFGPLDTFDYIRGGTYELLSGGYRPILAHAERYRSLCSDWERVQELARMGCYIQLNAESIIGKTGGQIKHFCRRLLKLELVHFVATDAHSDGRRGPYLMECAKYLKRKCGESYTRRLLQDNPERVIADQDI